MIFINYFRVFWSNYPLDLSYSQVIQQCLLKILFATIKIAFKQKYNVLGFKKRIMTIYFTVLTKHSICFNICSLLLSNI